MTLCTRHFERMDESLQCCWKCIAQERDPPLSLGPSDWWHRRYYCRCPQPHWSETLHSCCTRCGLPLSVFQIKKAA